MSTYNSAPRPELLGIRDISGRTQAVTPEQIPTHCPLFFTYAERGGEDAQLVEGSSADQYFGANTFNLTGQYSTHQTPFVKKSFQRANAAFVKRIIPSDAPPPAAVRLSIDFLPTQVAAWQRNEDGSYLTDESGEKIPELDIDDNPVFIDGFKVKWVASPVARRNSLGNVITPSMEAAAEASPNDPVLVEAARPVANAIGVASPSQGDQADEDTSVISTRYPIYELEVPWVGEAGKLQGARIFAATSESFLGDQSDLGAQLESFVYGIQFLEKADAATKAQIVGTLTQATNRMFVNKANASDPRTKVNYGYTKSVVPYWNDSKALLPIEGPFNKFFVYEANVLTVAEAIATAEVEHDDTISTDNFHLINIADFKSFSGIPYRTVERVSDTADSVNLNDISIVYAQGGGNGTMSPTAFNEAVREQFTRFGTIPGLNFFDYVKYPFSFVYDSGYDIETKLALLSLNGKRKDLFLVASTQDVGMEQNTDDEESSIGVSLLNRAQMFAESSLYGTEACRGMIVAQSGYLPDGEYEKLLPVTYDLLDRFAAYMSAGNKRWDTAAQVDLTPNNVIRTLINVNGTSRLEESFSKDWKNGITYARTWDRRSAFHPALRTFYPDETSILLSAINTIIACNLEQVAIISWRDTVGNAKLTAEERLEAVENSVISQVEGRYDGRVTIVATAYYTEEDRTNGNSCHVDIEMQGNNMGTVARFTVVASRADSAQ